jgi:hypothetical protein
MCSARANTSALRDHRQTRGYPRFDGAPPGSCTRTNARRTISGEPGPQPPVISPNDHLIILSAPRLHLENGLIDIGIVHMASAGSGTGCESLPLGPKPSIYLLIGREPEILAVGSLGNCSLFGPTRAVGSASLRATTSWALPRWFQSEKLVGC